MVIPQVIRTPCLVSPLVRVPSLTTTGSCLEIPLEKGGKYAIWSRDFAYELRGCLKDQCDLDQTCPLPLDPECTVLQFVAVKLCQNMGHETYKINTWKDCIWQRELKHTSNIFHCSERYKTVTSYIFQDVDLPIHLEINKAREELSEEAVLCVSLSTA